MSYASTMDDVHTPLREREAPKSSMSITTLMGIVGVVILAGFVVIGLGQNKLLNRSDEPPSLPTDNYQRALILMTENPAIDGHNDVAWSIRLNKRAPGQVYTPSAGLFNMSLNLTETGVQTDIPRLQAGKLGGQFWSVYVRCGMPDAVRATLEQIDLVKSFVAARSDYFGMAYSSSDITSIFNSKRLPSLMGMEGAHSIDGSFAALRQFYAAGVRYMSLTHNCNNVFAQAALGAAWPLLYPEVKGLTNKTTQPDQATGVELVLEMNRLGMIVDLAHTDASTQRDALATSQAPVIFSHANVFDVTPVSRNVQTDVIDKLKANGGVIMITFVDEFTSKVRPVTIDDVLKHVAFVYNRTGHVDNIGIGSDFDGIGYNDAGVLDQASDFPEGLKSVQDYPNLIAALLGVYSNEDVINMMGGNIQRVMREVEATASRLQGTTFQNERRQQQNVSCRSDF